MAKKLSYERYAWFHGRVKSSRFPNAAHLAAQFEICRKQAQRDVEFMRERLNARGKGRSRIRGGRLWRSRPSGAAPVPA